MPIAILAIDNGVTGGLFGQFPTGQIWVSPVFVEDLGKGGKRLDITKNLEWINRFILAARGCNDVVFACYEQSQKNPLFGCKGNFANGQNNEFWRVLLTVNKVAHCVVNPKTWQGHVFKDIRGDDTKALAALVVSQRFPRLDLSEYNKSERGGIIDAACIGIWAKETKI